MTQWLVRTSKNIIAGPYGKEQIRQLIHDKQLDLQDEVCPANGYWFFLHEREEVLKQLGVSMPRNKDDTEDVTETQTETLTETQTLTDSVEGGLMGPTPEVQQIIEASQDHTGVLNSNILRELQQKAKKSTAALGQRGATAPMPRMEVRPVLATPSLRGIERPSMWRGLVLLLIGAAAVVIFVVLRLIHRT